ncbi:hypothetical protein PENTCL1PPCAC_5893, partial [Pristionchus entomophagus]
HSCLHDMIIIIIEYILICTTSGYSFVPSSLAQSVLHASWISMHWQMQIPVLAATITTSPASTLLLRLLLLFWPRPLSTSDWSPRTRVSDFCLSLSSCHTIQQHTSSMEPMTMIPRTIIVCF